MRNLLILCAALLMSGCTSKQTIVTVTVNNPSANERSELVAVPADTVAQALVLTTDEQMIVTDNKGTQLPLQLTYDGQILFPVQVAAGATSSFTISKGIPESFASQASGALYAERKDDIAWENDRIAFRTYGPALQKSGEKAYGYDVWVKNVDTLVVADRYDKDLHHGITYHQDHGNGLDCYSVGTTLGGGVAALLNTDSTIVYPYCWKEYQILDNGPLRFTVKLTYNPMIVAGDSMVVETRLITLDKGSQLNRAQISYEGLSKATPLVAGIVIHPENPEGYILNNEAGYIGVEDLTDNIGNNNGSIFVGIVSPTQPDAVAVKPLTPREVSWFSDRTHAAYGHALVYTTIKPDESYTYYWGAGWSKYGFENMKAWESYLNSFSQNLKEPLQITISSDNLTK